MMPNNKTVRLTYTCELQLRMLPFDIIQKQLPVCIVQ